MAPSATPSAEDVIQPSKAVHPITMDSGAPDKEITRWGACVRLHLPEDT